MARDRRRFGRVEIFDEHKGYGEVLGESGDRWFFHCTAIADGSRAIDGGTRVSFTLLPGLRGLTEARDIRPL